MSTAPFDVAVAQRWFAVEMNNAAWDLVMAADRTAEQVEEMVHAAHAACIHWNAVGNRLNRLRAFCLLAFAYLAAQRKDGARHYAQLCQTLSDELGDEQAGFDRCLALESQAQAHALLNQHDLARPWRQKAHEVLSQLEDPEGRTVAEQIMRLAPAGL